jgi:hypothetical protein
MEQAMKTKPATKMIEPEPGAAWPTKADRDLIAETREKRANDWGPGPDIVSVSVVLHSNAEDRSSWEDVYTAEIAMPGIRVEDLGRAVDDAIANVIANSRNRAPDAEQIAGAEPGGSADACAACEPVKPRNTLSAELVSVLTRLGRELGLTPEILITALLSDFFGARQRESPAGRETNRGRSRRNTKASLSG